MKKIIMFLLALLLFSCAQAEELIIMPYAGGFTYGFQAEDDFLILQWQTDAEWARQTVYAADGFFAGDMELPHTFDSSLLTVTVETLKGKEILSSDAQTVAVEQTIPTIDLAEENTTRSLRDVEITPMVNAIGYAFRARGRESVLLSYRSSTEKGTITLYAGEDYIYNGSLSLPYTYDNNNVVLTVSDMRGNKLYEEMFRTEYPVPEAPVQSEVRLSGITVCIDPGHQAIARYTTEALGPGLSGTKETGVGMARGTVTRRLEFHRRASDRIHAQGRADSRRRDRCDDAGNAGYLPFQQTSRGDRRRGRRGSLSAPALRLPRYRIYAGHRDFLPVRISVRQGHR